MKRIFKLWNTNLKKRVNNLEGGVDSLRFDLNHDNIALWLILVPNWFQDKVASFNVGKSPVDGSEVNNNNTHKLIEDVNKELENIKTQPKYKEKTATTENVVIINTTSPKKTLQDLSLKPTASSYDESLDQFYDVFEALSTNS